MDPRVLFDWLEFFGWSSTIASVARFVCVTRPPSASRSRSLLATQLFPRELAGAQLSGAFVRETDRRLDGGGCGRLTLHRVSH